MYIIVGLGNPGREYNGTRHNIGFAAVDYIGKKYGISLDFKKHKGLCGKGTIEGEKVILVQPQTYMNLSGECLREVMDFYKVEPRQVIVIYDDISLDVGQLRVRAKGSAGGHNGIKSIIKHFHTEEFPRIKVGVGNKPAGWDLADYVLHRFDKGEMELVEETLQEVGEACALMISQGTEAAMNRFNGKKK